MSASVELQLLDSSSRVMDPDPDLDPTIPNPVFWIPIRSSDDFFGFSLVH
jgi:hypothetical protein